MKKFYLSSILFTWFILIVAKQSYAQVCEGDIVLSSQAEVDAFGCAEITGTLTISGDDITNLDALSGLSRVGALVISENDNLTQVNGLSGLIETVVEINGIYSPPSILISNNAMLTNLDGLSSLQTVRGPIDIDGNPSLETINGFSSLTSIFERLTITNNANLESINGFSGVEYVSSFLLSSLVIDNNPSLTNIDGLSSLEAIWGKTGHLQITNNSALTNINGLSSFAAIFATGASMDISNNLSLENIDGLVSLTRLGYEGVGTLTITQNGSLSQCSGLIPFLKIIAAFERGGTVSLSDNGAGCTVEDLLAASPQSVVAFSLVNPQAGSDEFLLGDSTTIDLANPFYANVALRARTFPSSVGSVVFNIDNKFEFIDNDFPYTFPLDFNKPGVHTIIADVYSLPNKQGIKGTADTAIVRVINGATILRFGVVDLAGNNFMFLEDGAEINIKDPAFRSFAIVAYTNPSTVSHVKFFLNNNFYRVENVPPYAFNGDINSVFNAWNPKPGHYRIRATPYIQVDGHELEGESLEVSFKVIAESLISVVSFDIIDTSGKVLRPLNEGDVIDLSDPGCQAFTIVANTKGQVRSVKFDLNNQYYGIENVVPYTLTGDQNGYFNPWRPSHGRYKLKATPYSKEWTGGEPGKPLIIHFYVTGKHKSGVARMSSPGEEDQPLETSSARLTVYPVPVDDALFMKTTDEIGNNASVTILTIQGLNVYKGPYTESGINTSDLKPGVYYLQVSGNNGTRSVVKFIKK